MLVKHKLMAILFFAWALLIAIVSSIPSLTVPGVDFWSSDKFAHSAEYLIFAILFASWRNSLGKPLLSTIQNLMWMALIIPVVDELHQMLIPGRQCSTYDMIADLLGFGTVIIYLLFRYRRLRIQDAA